MLKRKMIICRIIHLFCFCTTQTAHCEWTHTLVSAKTPADVIDDATHIRAANDR